MPSMPTPLRRTRRATVTAALIGVAVAALGPWGRALLGAGPGIPESRHGSMISSNVLQPWALASTAGGTRSDTGAAASDANRPQTPRPTRSPGAMRGIVPVLALSGAYMLRSASMVRKAADATAAAAAAAPAKPASAKRIDAFDSMRFFLIAYIACGHFIDFASPSPFASKAIKQINVVVGAFFALSGYVAAYTGCEVGEKKVKDKVAKASPPSFIVPRIMGYWPLHMFVLLLFSPMFIWVDAKFSGPITAAWHGLLSTTMTTAWFPMHAEVWNAPTWFLSALTFATMLTPYFLPVIAKQGKKELRRTALWLTLIGLLPKLAYCYDTNAWGFLEGSLPPRAFPNLAFFNFTRFNPVWAVLEVMLGAVACRLVMLDGTDGEKAPTPSLMDTLVPVIGMVGIILLRATGVVCISDMLVRPLLFMPLFLLFLMGLHRASLPDKVTDPVAKFLAWPMLTFLGGLSFPIFVVHGPLGQLFYKKAVAATVFGGTMLQLYGPNFFYAYLGAVLLAAYLLSEFFMKSQLVKNLSNNIGSALLKRL